MSKPGAPTFSPSLQLSTQSHRVVRTEARGGRGGGFARARRAPPPSPPPKGRPGRPRVKIPRNICSENSVPEPADGLCVMQRLGKK